MSSSVLAFGFFTQYQDYRHESADITSANIIKILPKPPLLPTIAATTIGARAADAADGTYPAGCEGTEAQVGEFGV